MCLKQFVLLVFRSPFQNEFSQNFGCALDNNRSLSVIYKRIKEAHLYIPRRVLCTAICYLMRLLVFHYLFCFSILLKKKYTHIHSHTKGIYLRYNGTWNDKTIFVVLLSDLYCCGGGQLKATISVFSGTVYAN